MELNTIDISESKNGFFSSERKNGNQPSELALKLDEENSLLQPQEMLQLVMDNIPQAILWKDKNLRYLGCNQKAARDAGLKSPEEIIGLTDYDLPGRKEQADLFRESDFRVMATNTSEHHILQSQLRADGTQAWLETNKIPLHDVSGNVVGILVTYQDITQRLRSEESLLRISKAVSSCSDAIGIADASGTHIYQNPAYSKLLEYESVEELNAAGGSRTTFIDPAVAKEVFDAMSKGKSWRGEVTKITKSGREIQVLLRADSIADRSGKIIGLICTNTDITARKQTEKELLENLQLLSTVIETVGEGITLSDSDGHFAIFNSKMEQLTGYTKEEAERSGNFLELLYPEERLYALAMAGLQEIMEKKEVRNVETTIKTKLGGYKTLLVSTSVLKYKNRLLFLSAYRDITDRQQAQEALRIAEYKYRGLFENAIIGIFQTTADGHYLNVNLALARIYGYSSPLELITHLINIEKQLYVDEQRRQEFARLLQQNDAVCEFESQVYRADGNIIWIAENARAVRDGQGELLYYEGTVEDITERKLAEQALRQQAERERLMGAIANRIRKSLKLEEILQTTVEEVREFLQTDRAIVCRFQPDGSRIVAVESVGLKWRSLRGTTISDTCLPELYLEAYYNNRVIANEDIHQANLNQCQVELLANLQIRANIVVPIVQGESLWGILAAHQCSATRQWQQEEIELLEQLAAQLAIAIQQAELYRQLEDANHELQRLATLDGLTQIANRRQFDSYLNGEWKRAIREQAPISLILCDVDFFKLYNDTYGHQAGDTCLQKIAMALTASAQRPADLVARYGGEEFAIILPNTDAMGALRVADRIKQEIKALKLPHAKSSASKYVTVSLGIASTVPLIHAQTVEAIALADKALYRAKELGRDRAICRLH